MPYCRAVDYLASKTPVIELCNQSGGRLAVCPEWNGRVFTSSCHGLDGDSFGYLNIAAIDRSDSDAFGGEDVWTVSPLVKSFQIHSAVENEVQLRQSGIIPDANGKPADLELTRTITFLPQQEIGGVFGAAVTGIVEQSGTAFVCFCTENSVQSSEEAVIASRLRGTYNAGKHTAVIFPHLPKDTETMDVDYQGDSPHRRRRRFSRSQLLRADGMGYCRITKPYTPSALFGAVDFRGGSLTLWAYDLPNPSPKDLIRIENHRKAFTSIGYWDISYEINAFSAAQKLRFPFSAVYRQYTLHISADNQVLSPLILQLFGTALEEFSKTVLR